MNANSAGYSAHVEMFLHLNGETLELGQLGPEHCMLREPREIPPSQAEIVLVVDDHETRIPVELPAGASATDRRIAYVRTTLPAPPLPTLASR